MNQVGKYYDHACQYVNLDNGYMIDFLNVRLYVPAATGAMTCDELQANYNELQFQIQGWTNRMVSANSTERQNIICVLNTQNAKLKDYQARLIDCNKIPTTETYTNTTETGEHTGTNLENSTAATTESGEAGQSNMLPWLLGGVALLGIYRYNKNRKRKH